MATFVRIVERRTLTAAARSLHTSLPTVVRTLSALEAELGVTLLTRTTRRVNITSEGLAYYEHCKELLETMTAVERSLRERGSQPRGRVVLTAPLTFGRLHVTPLLADFLQEHPQIAVELRLSDHVVNLTQEGVDLAVRLGKLHDSSAIALQVGKTRRIVCASPAYLARRGAPLQPQDLAEHTCIRLLESREANEWQFQVRRRVLRVPVSGPLDTNLLDAALAACEAGLGCGRFLGYQVFEALRRQTVQALLVKFEPPPVPIHLVYPHARWVSTRLRILMDWLAPRLRERSERY